MRKAPTNEVLPERLADHRAVQAWRQTGPDDFEPESIEILKLKRKTAVYRLTGAGSNGTTIIAKRCAAKTALVERLIYEEFLASLPVPALRSYGFVPEPGSDFCWLFLEDAGKEPYSPASDEHRALAGRWLATIHRALLMPNLRALLPDRGPAHYLERLRLARAEMRGRTDNPVLPAADVALLHAIAGQFDRIEEHWDEVKSCCESQPRVLVHGDFVIKNLRVRSGVNGPALLVYDWEMAGWGAPATDVAQFLGRSVSPDLDAYCSVLRQDFPALESRDLQRLAGYGSLLRIVDKIFWETVTMEGQDYEFLLKPIMSIRKYEPQLTAALRAVDWS